MAPTWLSLTSLLTVVSMATMTVHGHRQTKSLQDIHPRVIGGAEVLDRCRPPFYSMVALQFEANSVPFTFCSAVIWNDRFLITSGFCAQQLNQLGLNIVTAVVGERDSYMHEPTEQPIEIESVKSHPGYDSVTVDNNIALIRLATTINFTSCVQPVTRFVSQNVVCPDMDQSCLLAAWGPYADTANPVGSRLARSASITVLNGLVSSIWSRFKSGRDQPIGSVYADPRNRNVKTCHFDWGGIVACSQNGNWVLRGVIGEHNCKSESDPPIMVTDVPFFHRWIDRCLADWSRC